MRVDLAAQVLSNSGACCVISGQLLCHDGSLQYTSTGGVNQVSILCHLEANKSDTHSVLIEEDIGMGAVHMCGGKG